MEQLEIRYRHDLLNDKWVSQVVFPGLREGFFVEAGATNGVNGSGTYILEKEYEWSGICVEPIPHQCLQIPKYRDAYSLNACLFDRTGEKIEFTHYPKRSGHSSISAVNKNAEKLGDEVAEQLIVPTITLVDVLNKFEAPQEINYLCLDTEGSERIILEKFFSDTSDYRILAASIEGHKCDDLMLANGYVATQNPFSDNTFESYFVHQDIADQVKAN